MGCGGETAAASVKLMYAPVAKPTLIKALADVTITKVACGHNHTVALDDKSAAYSWGAHPFLCRAEPITDLLLRTSFS